MQVRTTKIFAVTLAMAALMSSVLAADDYGPEIETLRTIEDFERGLEETLRGKVPDAKLDGIIQRGKAVLLRSHCLSVELDRKGRK